MARGRVPVGAWLFRLLAWDAVLPALMVFSPVAVAFVFPNRRGMIELTAITLPIAALFVRIVSGSRYIGSNHCTQRVRNLQWSAFLLAVVPLVLIDCVAILSHLMPKEAQVPAAVWIIIYGIYFALMAIAMYPGRICEVAGIGDGPRGWIEFDDWRAVE